MITTGYLRRRVTRFQILGFLCLAGILTIAHAGDRYTPMGGASPSTSSSNMSLTERLHSSSGTSTSSSSTREEEANEREFNYALEVMKAFKNDEFRRFKLSDLEKNFTNTVKRVNEQNAASVPGIQSVMIAKWPRRLPDGSYSDSSYDIKLVGTKDGKSWTPLESELLTTPMLKVFQMNVEEANAFFDCMNKCYTVVLRRLNREAKQFPDILEFRRMCVDYDGKLEVEVIKKASVGLRSGNDNLKFITSGLPDHFVEPLTKEKNTLVLYDLMYQQLKLTRADDRELYDMTDFMMEHATLQYLCTTLYEFKI